MPNTKETVTPHQKQEDRFERVPLAALQESPLNPRKRFNETKLQELAASIRQYGIIEPLVVREDIVWPCGHMPELPGLTTILLCNILNAHRSKSPATPLDSSTVRALSGASLNPTDTILPSLNPNITTESNSFAGSNQSGASEPATSSEEYVAGISTGSGSGVSPQGLNSDSFLTLACPICASSALLPTMRCSPSKKIEIASALRELLPGKSPTYTNTGSKQMQPSENASGDLLTALNVNVENSGFKKSRGGTINGPKRRSAISVSTAANLTASSAQGSAEHLAESGGCDRNLLSISWEIVAGARRFKAAKMAANGEGDDYIVPCVVKDITDTEALEMMVIENGQRTDIHFLEEAQGYADLIVLAKYTPAEIARRIGKEEGYVHRRLSLLELIPEAKEICLSERNFSFMHAQAVARLQSEDQQEVIDWWKREVENNDYPSAAATAAYIASDIMLDLTVAPFPVNDETLVPAAGPCAACPKRSGAAPALFPEVKKGDMCLDRHCFEQKKLAIVDRRREEVEARGLKLVQLSNSYYTNDKSILHRGAYVPLGPEEPRCSFAEDGVYAQGHAEGTLAVICRSSECKVHAKKQESFSNGYRKEPTAPEEKLKEKQRELATTIEHYYPRGVAAAIYGTVARSKMTSLPVDDLRLVAHTMFEGFDHERRKELARDVFAFEAVRPPKTQGITPMPDWDTPVEQAIEKWDTQDLLGFVLALAGEHFKSSHDKRTSYDYRHGGYGEKKGPTVLEQLAVRYKVDPKAVRAEVEKAKKAEFEPRIKRVEKLIAVEAEKAETAKLRAAAEKKLATIEANATNGKAVNPLVNLLKRIEALDHLRKFDHDKYQPQIQSARDMLRDTVGFRGAERTAKCGTPVELEGNSMGDTPSVELQAGKPVVLVRVKGIGEKKLKGGKRVPSGAFWYPVADLRTEK